MNSSKNLLQND